MIVPVPNMTTPGKVLTFGEALVAALPVQPVGIDDNEPLRLYVGGAEVNFAIGMSRLGLRVEWLGCVGDDPLGRLVTSTLSREAVDVGRVVKSDAPTGLYLREWLPDGARRPYYYRKESAGSRLNVAQWPLDAEGIAWLHLTGITPALSETCQALVTRAVDWARDYKVPISFDPNYRRQLWNPDTAREVLLPLLTASHTVLLGVDEAELLLDTNNPEEIYRRAHALGVEVVVVKRGAQGACAFYEGSRWDQNSYDVDAIDPVGAGDAFDAGFIAAMRMGHQVRDALRLGAFVGAKVASTLGENEGGPYLRDLPDDVLPVESDSHRD